MENVDLEEIKRERPLKPFDMAEFQKMAQELEWGEDETIEALLNDLKQ